MNKLNLSEAKELILNNNLGSIYSKEDVINLLNRIEEEKQVQEKPTFDLEDIKEKVIREIRNIISDCDTDDMVDKENVEFTICHGNRIELENVDVSLYVLENNLTDSMDMLFNEIHNDMIEQQN